LLAPSPVSGYLQHWRPSRRRWPAGFLPVDHLGRYAAPSIRSRIHNFVSYLLGDGREALRRAARVDIARLPASLVERRTTLLIDIARSHAGQGDHGAAGDTLLEAERL